MKVERDINTPIEVYSNLHRDGKTYYYARLYTNHTEKIDEENKVHYSADCYTTPEMKPFASTSEAEKYYKAHFDEELRLARAAENRENILEERAQARELLAAGDYVNSKAIEELMYTDITLEAWRAKYRKEYGPVWRAKREEQREVLNV